MSRGVEWAVHAASLLVALPEGAGLSADALARYHGVPPAYMAKQLQALSKAGLVITARGARGGYRLAKRPDQITLLDLFVAIEGDASAFRCMEIRQNGPCGQARDACRQSCPIASAFLAAEAAFRGSLEQVTLADITLKVTGEAPPEHMRNVLAWIDAERV